MNKFKSFLVIATFCFTTALFAKKEETATIDQKLSSLRLEKMQAENIVASMVKRGHLNNDDALRIKREIASVKEEDITTIKSEALENIKTNNSFANQ
jgi:polyhydroxyalkanoate synthesis regulator phasin